MVDPAAQTTQLVQWLDRMRAGDRAARDELIRGFQGRLGLLARKMLHRYPKVGRWVDAEDVLQNALLRLLRALESVQPDSTRAFFGLAAEQMRRELLDLTRHYYGPEGVGANHESVGPRPGESRPGLDPPAPDTNSNDLERWSRFHEEVEELPVREREVVGLVFYHGWTQVQVAELFQVDVRTVRRWWESALVRLRRVMKDADLAHRDGRDDADGFGDPLGRESTPEFAAMVSEDYERLLDALGDETLRQIARWKRDGLTNQEISERIGCTRRMVSYRLDLIRKIWRGDAT
ncbi:MAG TPA: sigma-70 family RNA polymerase sigma factor [Isosphaeraceae bacterium]|nr:sigma-70 family RNA polymerase sigma factor [Isosphaeraceae bacterium]